MKENPGTYIKKLGKWIEPKLLLPAFYLAGCLCFFWNPLSHLAVSSFDRIIGQALIYGTDISARIQNMTVYGFVLFPVFFLITYALCYVFCGKCEEKNRASLQFISEIAAVALIPLIIGFLNIFRGKAMLAAGYGVLFPAVMIACFMLAMLLGKNKSTLR